jgi:hypothetical protein
VKRGLFHRFAPKVTLVVLLVAATQPLSATVAVSSGARAASVPGSPAIHGAVPSPNDELVDVVLAGGDLLPRSAPAPSPRRDQSPGSENSIADPAAWAILPGIFLIALIGLANSPVSCTLLGHRRSKRSVTFNDRERQWVSTCRRCRIELRREALGDWVVASVARGRATVLEPVVERKDRHNDVRTARSTPCQTEQTSLVPPVRSNSDECHRANGPPPRANEARTIVRQLLDDVVGGKVAPPGARAALFLLVDELRAEGGMDEKARVAEAISIEMLHLQSALQRGAEDEAEQARRELGLVAGEWLRN